MTLDDHVSVDVRTRGDGVSEVALSGRVGWGVDTVIRGRLAESSGEGWSSGPVVLNLAEVGFMDSSGISALLTLCHLVAEGGGKLVLCDVPPRINQMFDLVGMSKLIPIVDSIHLAQEISRA